MDGDQDAPPVADEHDPPAANAGHDTPLFDACQITFSCLWPNRRWKGQVSIMRGSFRPLVLLQPSKKNLSLPGHMVIAGKIALSVDR